MVKTQCKLTKTDYGALGPDADPLQSFWAHLAVFLAFLWAKG